MPDTPIERHFTINSNAQISSTTFNGQGVEPVYPSIIAHRVEQQKTVQMIERHEHDSETHAKRVLMVNPDGTFVDENNRFPVDAFVDVGDIHIGAVEIKDKDSDIRATVIQRVGDTALIVQDFTEWQKSVVNIYGEANIAWDAETTLATYTVPANYTFHFDGGIIGGNADGEFMFRVGGTIVAKVRNTAAARSIIMFFKNAIKVNAGGVCSITAKNVTYRKNVGGSRAFEATINGYRLPV